MGAEEECRPPGPLILTLAANWFGNVRIGDQFLIPAFAALPVAFLFLSRLKSASSERRMMATIVAVLWCGAVVAATPVGFYTFKSTETGANEPRRAIAMRVTELWRQSYGRRLEIVSGTEAFATATSFYSADRPSYLQLGNPAASPWVTREKKKASGFAIICTVDPDDCRGLTAAYDSKNSRRMTIAMPRRYLGQTLPDFEIEVIFVPPAGVAP